MSLIHPTAIIDPKAKLAEDVSIGAYSIIGEGVEIGAGTWIGPHVVINGPTVIGENNKIYQFSSIGGPPQDISYKDEPTCLEIGNSNVIRENCTLSRGTVHGGGVTRFGNQNYMMSYAHVAHDCQVGNHVIFANGASLGGHAVIEDHVTLAGFALIHQFVKVGMYSFCGMGCGISKDVPPYIIVAGNPAQAHGLNTVGLKRNGISSASIKSLRSAYKTVYKSGFTLAEALIELKHNAGECEEVDYFSYFIVNAKRSIVR